MLSIGAPIALIEALAPGGEATPWLGRFGLALTGLEYLGGSLLIGWDNWTKEHFQPTPLQLTSAAVLIAALIAIAFTAIRILTRPRSAARRSPA
jgi:hypothetical protein